MACRADLSGPVGVELWEASERVVEAIQARDEVIARLPTLEAAAVPVTRTPAAVLAPRDPAPAAAESPVRVQSVLSVAGAALVAISALVFTFFNPDLTDLALRTVVLGVVSAGFLASAWLLSRAKLRFSAEAVGALGAVFIALDVWAASALAGVVAASVVSFSLGAALVALSIATRIRAWLLAGLVAAAVSPALLGSGIDGAWAPIAAYLVAGFGLIGLRLLLARLEGRFGGTLLGEKVALVILRFAVLWIVLAHVAVIGGGDLARGLTQAATLVALAGFAVLGARFEVGQVWNFFAGGLIVGAVLPLVWIGSEWMIAVIPAAALVVLIAVTLLRPPVLLVLGAWIALLVLCLPGGGLGLLDLLTLGTFADLTLQSTAAIACAAVGSLAVGLRTRELRPLGVLGAAWFAVDALLTFVVWNAIAIPGQVALALGLAVALGAVSVLVRIPRWLRISIVTGAHLLVVLAATIAWRDTRLTVILSIAVIVVLALLSRAVATPARVVTLGVVYAYSLVVLGTFFALRGEDPIVVLCIVSSVASAVALGTTLIRRVGARAWYAILVVTSVPFVIGVISVLVDRRGWTGISTAVTFALALVLVLTTRPGLNRYLRAAAAALLVPALAVVAVCLGSYWLASSGSPIVLPVIASIVALVLPSTGLIERLIARRGIGETAMVRTAIEVSTLVTAAIATLLAIVLPATGSLTTFIVLTIIAVGATAAGLLNRRRYAWIVAAIAWTGALWAFLALSRIDVVELYLLPPALAAALLGALAAARGIDAGRTMYCVGLAVAVIAPLGALLTADPLVETPWRALGLLAAAIVLLVVAVVMRRWATSLEVPTLVGAIAAASAGALQAVRYGRAIDPTVVNDAALLGVALAFSGAAALLAALAGRGLTASTTSRWVYAPAVAMLVAGPIAAVRVELSTAWVMWLLMVALLALMIATVATRARTLPPVWFTFTIAWSVAVAGWSTREWFRVEGFSLPLGVALLVAGIIVLRRPAESDGTAQTWPIGFSGSWRLLAPGLIVTLGPSMLATATDPQTWRAILVIALALAAILLGSLTKLAAPFALGIIVLPIENVLVFAVQIGRQIGATPWWITLATAGAALLVIAATSERRSASGSAARLRDLA